MINYPRYSYNYIATATTTQVATGTGTLHTITVTGGTAGTIIVYDETGSGTTNIIASFSSTNAIASYKLDIAFAKGLKIVTGSATQLTISYLQ